MNVTGPSFSSETIIISRKRPVLTVMPVDASSATNRSNIVRARSGSSALSKLGRRPFVVVRGRPDLVLPAGEDGPGAGGLLREPGADLFGLGSREAVVASLRADAADRVVFGAPVDAEALAAMLTGLTGLTGAEVVPGAGEVTLRTGDPRTRWVVEVAAYAHGWETESEAPSRIRLRPVTP